MKDYSHYHERLKNHTLEVIEEGEISVFRLREKPRSRMMSTMLIFTPEGIAIMGDLTPELRGTVSVYGYGLAWFASANSPDYLCSKFLDRKWDQNLAIEELKERAKSGHEDQAAVDELLEELGGDFDARQLHDAMDEANMDVSDSLPGRGYLEHEAGWLCAIQRKFAELYAAHQSAFHIVSLRSQADLAQWMTRSGAWTCDLSKAGRFTQAEVQENADFYDNPGETKPIPCSLLQPKISAVSNQVAVAIAAGQPAWCEAGVA